MSHTIRSSIVGLRRPLAAMLCSTTPKAPPLMRLSSLSQCNSTKQALRPSPDGTVLCSTAWANLSRREVRRWSSGGVEGEGPPAMEEVSVSLAKEMVDAHYVSDPSGGSVQLLDVREPREIQVANLGKYGWRWTALPLNSQFEEWREDVAEGELLDKDKPTFVLCHAGMRSRFVGEYLTQACGFRQVYNITGGIDAWSLFDPDIPRY